MISLTSSDPRTDPLCTETAAAALPGRLAQPEVPPRTGRTGRTGPPTHTLVISLIYSVAAALEVIYREILTAEFAV
jgi:hypothetical protein